VLPLSKLDGCTWALMKFFIVLIVLQKIYFDKYSRIFWQAAS
jgi:hypothetical protein